MSNLKDYEFEREIFEGLKRKHIKEAGSEGGVVEGQVPQTPIEPSDPRKILSDLTFEGLLHHFESGSPSVGIFSDEGGQIFGGHAMSKDKLLKTVAGLSKVWDAAPLNRTRAGQPLRTFRHRRGCLHLMLQDKVAESVLVNEILNDQGFLSRCLIAVPESHIGTRLIREDDTKMREKERAKLTLSEFSGRISHLLSKSKDLNGDAKELNLGVLSLDPGARDELMAFANRLEAQQAKGQSLEGIRGFASKAAEQAARIAGVFTLLADPDAQAVCRETMSDAVQLANWYVEQALCALDAGYVDPAMKEADQLRQWLIKKHRNTPFVKRDVVKNGPGNIRDTRKVERLLTILEEYHWVEMCPSVEKGPGARTQNMAAGLS